MGNDMKNKISRRTLDRKVDHRGWLVKILMRQHLESNTDFGEIYITTATPGNVKGNHYHRETTEWFCVLAGTARLVTQDTNTGETDELIMSADEPSVVTVPPVIAHAFENIGDDNMMLLAYADVPYDASSPDEVKFEVIPVKE
jgi:dTDP-4-dehydrorhamnose 3,5-epimerase